MKNPVVDMAHFGKVYKRKIDVFMRQVDTNGKPISCTGWMYIHSTNAYPRCIDASRSASFGKGSHFQYKAWFAK